MKHGSPLFFEEKIQLLEGELTPLAIELDSYERRDRNAMPIKGINKRYDAYDRIRLDILQYSALSGCFANPPLKEWQMIDSIIDDREEIKKSAMRHEKKKASELIRAFQGILAHPANITPDELMTVQVPIQYQIHPGSPKNIVGLIDEYLHSPDKNYKKWLLTTYQNHIAGFVETHRREEQAKPRLQIFNVTPDEEMPEKMDNVHYQNYGGLQIYTVIPDTQQATISRFPPYLRPLPKDGNIHEEPDGKEHFPPAQRPQPSKIQPNPFILDPFSLNKEPVHTGENPEMRTPPKK